MRIDLIGMHGVFGETVRAEQVFEAALAQSELRGEEALWNALLALARIGECDKALFRRMPTPSKTSFVVTLINALSHGGRAETAQLTWKHEIHDERLTWSGSSLMRCWH